MEKLQETRWRISAFGYDQEIVTSTGVTVTERANEYYFNPNTTLKFQQSGGKQFLTISKGGGYLKVGMEPVSIGMSNQVIELTKVFAFFNATDQSLTILSGELTNPQVNARVNESIKVTGNSQFATEPLIRATLLQNTEWANMLTYLHNQEQLPRSLTDLEPPTISITQPTVLTTSEEFIPIIGTITDGTIAKFDNQPLELDSDGTFHLEADLEIGPNTFEIHASDSWNNIATKTLTITRKAAQIVSTAPSTINCNIGNTVEKVLCSINAFRNDSSAPTLTTNLVANNISISLSVGEAVDIDAELNNGGINFQAYRTIGIDIPTNASAQYITEQLLVNYSGDLTNDQYQQAGLAISDERLVLLLLNIS